MPHRHLPPPRIELTPPTHSKLTQRQHLREDVRYASEELLLRVRDRSNVAHDARQRHTHGLSPSRSVDGVSPSLATACENITRSNRSLVEHVRRDVTNRTNSGRRDKERKDTVAVSVQKMPGSGGDPPTYVFDDGEARKPSVLERSKSFLQGGADKVRKSFRRRTNTAESGKKTSLAERSVETSGRKRQTLPVLVPEVRVGGKLQDQSHAQTGYDEGGGGLKSDVKLQKRSSFKMLRKRLFSK